MINYEKERDKVGIVGKKKEKIDKVEPREIKNYTSRSNKLKLTFHF